LKYGRVRWDYCVGIIAKTGNEAIDLRAVELAGPKFDQQDRQTILPLQDRRSLLGHYGSFDNWAIVPL